jgi:hypothetical protein
VHITVDMLGYSLTVKVPPANQPERAQVKELTAQAQEVPQHSVKLAYVGQGYIGDQPERDAKQSGPELVVVKQA